VITPALIDDLRQIIPCDPEHLPLALDLIGLVADRLPGVPQIACFDTAFHRGMPRVATLFALPRRFEALGIQRYGFHGLSYAYQMQELARLGDPAATRGRVILAHLGNGASLAAVRDGTGIDTSMGFTPAGGLPMSTRSGDIDPGIIAYLMAHQAMTGDQIHHLVNHESGLLGISETSGDMRDLEAAAPTDVRAAEAVSCFCYQVSKGIGAFAATLGGVDTLTFAGGIGEHSPAIRARICAPLGFCGIALDATRNAKDAAVISADWAGTSVRVIRTDEEVMIARAMRLLLESSQLLGHLS
jgi:acetate kinase